MFRITNLQNQQETCANRDELLSVINEKSVWAEDRNETFTLQLEQLAEDGSLLDHRQLSLPLQSIVEEVLDGFGLQRERKGFSLPLLRRNKPQKAIQGQELREEEKQGHTEPTSAPPSKTTEALEVVEEARFQKPKKSNLQKVPRKPKTKLISNSLLWKLLSLGTLVLSLGSFVLIVNQAKTIKSLDSRIRLEVEQGKVEVVGRFFIANYYTGNNDNLKDFLSKDLKLEGVEAKQDEQVQSTIYEAVSSENNTIKVTFVVTTKGQDDSIKTVRLTLPFKESENSVYSYVLVGQPKFSSFG